LSLPYVSTQFRRTRGRLGERRHRRLLMAIESPLHLQVFRPCVARVLRQMRQLHRVPQRWTGRSDQHQYLVLRWTWEISAAKAHFCRQPHILVPNCRRSSALSGL